MKSFADALQSVAVTLWVGGMWTIGFVVTPLLFARVPERMLAGLIAGKLFTLAAYIGIVCALVLLLLPLARFGSSALRQGTFWVVLLMLALIMVGEFGVQPVLESLKAQALPKEVMASILRDRFATWHGVASGLYVIQSLLGLVLVVRQNRGLK
jgi:MFS family permease